MKISIAIPAFNEEERLPRLLAFLRDKAPASVAEILVCDSLSSDATADVPQRIGDARVRTISADRPGKPAAWNALIHAARSPVIVFLDADVFPAPQCLERLIAAAATDSSRLIHGARRRATGPAALRLLTDPIIELSLAGGCYALRREPLLARLADQGFQQMPDVFAEDVWLQSLLAPAEFQILDDCVFDFEIRSFSAYLRMQARKRLTTYEIDERFPALGRRLRRNFPQAVRPQSQLKAAMQAPTSLSRKLAWVAAGAVKATLNLALRGPIRAQYDKFEQGYQRDGGSYVLRRLASTGLRP